MTDEELVLAWRTGDEAAGGELLERHFPALYRFFRNKLGSGIDDLIQQTMLNAVRSKERFRGDGSFRAYLFAIARNELYAVLRTGRRAAQVDDIESHALVDLTDSPSQVVGRTREETLLLRSLRQLPLPMQVLVELHYWEELSMRDLGLIMDVPVGTVKSRLRKARLELKDVMERLSEDPAVFRTTLDDLERWAASIKDAANLSGARDSR